MHNYNGLRNRGSIPGLVKDFRNILDAALLSTQHYKVRIKDKVEQSRELISDLPFSSVLLQFKMEPSVYLRTKVDNFTLLYNLK